MRHPADMAVVDQRVFAVRWTGFEPIEEVVLCGSV